VDANSTPWSLQGRHLVCFLTKKEQAIDAGDCRIGAGWPDPVASVR
jgi:hypothetical protein